MSQYFTSIFNPGMLTEQELVKTFTIRVKEYNMILKKIKDSKEMLYPPQHIIIQGQRGSGKTTLLRRLYYEIKRDTELENIIPVIFNEEQYGIYNLKIFWNKLSEYITEVEGFEDISDYIEKLLDENCEEPAIFKKLEEYLHKNSKKLILFIDNFGELLNKFSELDNRRMREILTSSSDIWIIGGSPSVMEITYDYLQPFFDFFEIIQLEGLNKKDTDALLLGLGKARNNQDIEIILKTNSGKTEALRRLTGGVPRTIVLLYDIFVDSENNGNSFDDLDVLLDKVTPLYKHRMDDLNGIQQPIVEAIALNWDKVKLDDIIKKTRLERTEVEKQLYFLYVNGLIDRQQIEKEEYLYSVRERFFNIWYLMRNGRKKDATKVKWLSQFLEIWCDQYEIVSRSKRHIKSLLDGKLRDVHAIHMTIALAETCLLEDKDKRWLLTQTKNYLREKSPELIDELNDYTKDKYSMMPVSELLELVKVNDLMAIIELARFYYNEKEEYDKSKKYLLMAIKIDAENSYVLGMLGRLYDYIYGDYAKAEQYYLKAAELGNSHSRDYLGVLYEKRYRDYAKAEHHYLKAIEMGNSYAANDLGRLYENQYKDYAKAEQCYLKATEMGNEFAANDLGLLYENKYKDYAKAEQYYLKAIEMGNKFAAHYLGHLYENQHKDYTKAEQYYLKGTEMGNSYAATDLGRLYEKQHKDYAKAEQYYLKAIEMDNKFAANYLGRLYEKQHKDYAKAEQYYLKATEMGNKFAAHYLGCLYENEYKDYAKAEQYYLKAIEMDNEFAAKYLGYLYENKFKDYVKAEQFYFKAIEKGDLDVIDNLKTLYKVKYNDFHNTEKNIMLIDNNVDPKLIFYLANLFLDLNRLDNSLMIVNKYFINSEFFEIHSEIATQYFICLMANKQYSVLLKILNDNPNNLKERYKPVYFALMNYMKAEFPHEYKKMGEELKETVKEIIEEVKSVQQNKFKTITKN